MVKECKVIMKNSINMVVLFDGVEVQMPSNNEASATTYVKFDNGKYIQSSKDEYKKELASVKKAKAKPKNEEKSSD